MPQVLNDGDIPFGASIVVINGVDYCAEEIEFEEKSTAIYRRNEINVPNGGVYIKDLVKGKMTLQLASNDTVVPEGQTVVSIPFRGADTDFVITNISAPQKQDEIHKLKMEITEILNPTNVTTTG